MVELISKPKQNSVPVSPTNYLWVSVEKTHQDELEMSNGQKIYIDTTFRPEHHVTIKGKIESVPKTMSDREFGDNLNFNDIKPEAEVGDTAYFHYLTVCDENKYTYEGKDYYRLAYPNLFCVVREGEIIMIGSWCLVEPIEDKDVEEIHLKDGYVLGKQTPSGIIYSLNTEPLHNIGKIRHFGTPLKNTPKPDYQKDDVIVFEKHSEFVNKIEGKSYYCMRQSQITGHYY